MPRYVVLPGARDEVAAVVSLAGSLGLPFAVRGNGGSVFGCVFSDGLVLDMNRFWPERPGGGDLNPSIKADDLKKAGLEPIMRGHRPRARAAGRSRPDQRNARQRTPS
jgi:hypothetical protein